MVDPRQKQFSKNENFPGSHNIRVFLINERSSYKLKFDARIFPTLYLLLILATRLDKAHISITLSHCIIYGLLAQFHFYVLPWTMIDKSVTLSFLLHSFQTDAAPRYFPALSTANFTIQLPRVGSFYQENSAKSEEVILG